MGKYYPIIGLSGKAGSGKTAAAEYMKANYDKVKTVALADPIKQFLFQCGSAEDALWGESDKRDALADICYKDVQFINNCIKLCNQINLISSIDAVNLYNALYENNKLTIRKACQVIGTWARYRNKSAWIDYGLQQAKMLLNEDGFGCNLVIVPDLRYRNEILAIKELGGYLIKIERKTEKELNHPSETELDTVPDYWYDTIIQNNEDLNYLYSQLNRATKEAYG